MSRQYREFKIGDLFDVILGVNVPHKHLLLVGEYGVVTGSTERNGCAGYLDDIGNYLLKENVITVSNRGEHSGTAFYQDKKVVIGSNVLCLIPKIKLNKYIGLYICVVINNLGYGGYTNYPTKNKIVKDLLLLPITSQGVPDWQYMEDFMKEIESETQQTIETLDKINTISRGGGV